MTDAPRRRDNDKEAADLYPLVQEAIVGIANVNQMISEELVKAEAVHATFAPKEHIHQQLEDNVNQIIDVLEGPAVAQPFGQAPIRNDGLVDAVALLVVGQAEIKETLGNGGIKVKLPWTVWVAIIGALSGLVVALIETLGNRPPG